MPGPEVASQADILALLTEGYSNREIGRQLRTARHRVARIRHEHNIPDCRVSTTLTTLTLEQTWHTFARTVTAGHMRWTGEIHGTTPCLVYRRRRYTARRVAFVIAHGREPVGRVRPGCGHDWCVAPEHTTDQPMSRAGRAHARIAGRAV